ncbi:MAG: 30S ribosomal protein S6 [Phycisphaerae bacterium]|nr:30S ribosomal protein S6 [Phycisphaerae bacterium]
MAEKRINVYEAMFLLSPAVAADLGGALAHINEILQRGHAEVVAMRKWFEGRLAYEVKGQKRGVYILAYFKAPAGDIAHIERDCNLSEKIMRALILRCDHLSGDEIATYDGRKDLEIEARMRTAQPEAAPEGAPVASATAE